MDQGLSHHRSLNSLILSFDPMYSLCTNRGSIIPLFISSLDSSSLRELKLHFDVWHERDSQTAFDWVELSKALISLHQRCPAVALTLSWCVPIHRQTKLPDLAAVYGKTLQDALHAGLRIAVVRTEPDETYSRTGSGWFEAAMDNRWWPVRPGIAWL